MKRIVLLLLTVTAMSSCQEVKKKGDITDGFEKSYKEQKEAGLLPQNSEHLDSTTNIYSNYKYNVAFDAPDNWVTDTGVNEHTIFRTYEADSAITFMINVIEVKLSEGNKGISDIWEFYQENREKMDYPYRVLIPEQFNTTVEDFKASKSYIKNQLSIKRSFNYMVREMDYEYSNTSIMYQTFIDKFTYTFGLDVPTMFYDENPDYYEDLFSKIYFLNNKDKLNQFLNNQDENE